ncbi:MAG: filamentous hemagglutinin N-terminal domain-containing protein, partial [Phycisphaerae bacterium]|nr:filamentous hemagglutinin N-terminal domain-containing protein [Phycisphaerae bacterium]
RILNRINSASPTSIMGSVSSNGRVYFINRAGVVFGKEARIDVAGLFAAAGNITNGDFIAGRDRVTGMQGQVRNHGVINGGKEVVLAGRSVVNTGTIETGAGGLVAMVAGDTVTLHRSGGRVGVQVSGGTKALGGGGNAGTGSSATGILNSGTVRSPGGRMVAMAGDLASLAINLEGTILAQSVDVDGGAKGNVRVAGLIDATGAGNGRAIGGTVHVTGRDVLVTDAARIDASGPRGGGEVLIGGGYQGADARVRNAVNVVMERGALIRADATHVGDGGRVILWSDRRTDFLGIASVRGSGAAGRGGFVETSGKLHLNFDGVADVRGSVDGLGGTLLLDPGFLIVQNTAGGVDTLGISALNSQLALGNVVIQNSGVNQDSGIQWNATSTLTGLNSSSLTLNAQGAGAAVNITAAPAFGTWTGDFNVVTQDGAITVGSAISRTAGNISMTAGGGNTIALNGATVSTAGNVSFTGPVTLGANTTVSGGTGSVTFGGSVTGSGGNRNLTVNSTGATTFGGSLSSIGVLTTN